MAPDSLAALLAVNQTHCRQIHNHVKYIAVATLVKPWPSLLTWNLGHSGILHPEHTMWPPYRPSTTCYSTLQASDETVSLLLKEYPGQGCRMQYLMLSGGSISAAGIAQLHHASCNRLQSCCLRNVGLSSAAIQALCGCADTWPLLQRLDLSHKAAGSCGYYTSSGSNLASPKRAELSCTGLSHEAFQRLCLLSSDCSSRGSSNSSCSGSSSSVSVLANTPVCVEAQYLVVEKSNILLPKWLKNWALMYQPRERCLSQPRK